MGSEYEDESDSEVHERRSVCNFRTKRGWRRKMNPAYEDESDSEGSKTDEVKQEEEKRSVGDLRTKIFQTLKQIKTPSAFAYSAVDLELPNPILHIPPHETVGLPLSTVDAQKIISQASQSPFGKGEETLIDTTVRKSWELNPNQFSLKNPAWNKALKKIVDTVTTGLGLDKRTEKISADLYKLLLYETGAFFKPHRDSPKAPGMFATLVVCLPSLHEGGKLVLTHNNEKYEFETASSSSLGFSYAAWYSDITHEVLPVVTGYRLMLTYNLIRQADFEIPLYGLVSGHVKQLSTLLEQYNSQLEGGDKLPPILLHKLEHKYTKASLKLNMLKPPDLGQVQILKQLSTQLGFDIYLATWVLTVKRDDECEDYEKKTQSLRNMVELDGKLVEEKLRYPGGALIDPMPQGSGKADEEEHEGFTGNEGAPATYWYRDTVVVLVPPSKRLDFVFQFESSGSIIEPLFVKLMQELSQDPARKPKQEKLCELALKPKPKQRYYDHSQDLEPIPPYLQEAAAAALDIGRIDLFDEACKTTGDKIMLDNAHMLGRRAANNGVATMLDRLLKGVHIAPSVAKKVEFLKAVAEGFETAVPEPNPAEKASLKQWSDEAIFTAAVQFTTLTKTDGVSLAQLCESVGWSQFESKMKPVILKAATTTKTTFVNGLMSCLQQELNEEQRSFIKMLIHKIWNGFVFEAKYPKPVQPTSSSYSQLTHPVSTSCPVNGDHLNEKDILQIVENTILMSSPESVETTIIPAMLTAIPTTSKDCAKGLFILLVRMILKDKLVGFGLPTNKAIPPPSHKRLVQALLNKFLLETVGLEPQAPKNWSLPARSCKCADCSVVNRFLQNPRNKSLDFPCSKARRHHLHQNFTNCSQSSYDVTTIRDKSPNVWRITKHLGNYQTAKSEWFKNTKTAIHILSTLKKDEPVKGRLEAYLQPFYNIIMTANVKELPDLNSLVSTPQSSGSNKNSALALNQPTNQTGQKRVLSYIDLTDDELAKRTRS